MSDDKNFNWKKKISLKEIAQFYEDRLRELDAKEDYIDHKINELESKTNEFKNSLKSLDDVWETTKYAFIHKLDDAIIPEADKYLKAQISNKKSQIYSYVNIVMRENLDEILAKTASEISSQIYVQLGDFKKSFEQDFKETLAVEGWEQYLIAYSFFSFLYSYSKDLYNYYKHWIMTTTAQNPAQEPKLGRVINSTSRANFLIIFQDVEKNSKSNSEVEG